MVRMLTSRTVREGDVRVWGVRGFRGLVAFFGCRGGGEMGLH